MVDIPSGISPKKIFLQISYIIKEFGSIPESKYFIPDDINPTSLSHNYLFTVIIFYNLLDT